jgi:Flp pilus assembly protein CpaB
MASSTTATNGRIAGGGLAPLGLTPEAAARKTQRRVNTRLLAGLVLVAVAFIGFLVFVVSSAPVTRGIVVATRDLPAGTRLSRADLAVAQVQVGQAQAQAAVPASALDGLAGKELVAPAFAQGFFILGRGTAGSRMRL